MSDVAATDVPWAAATASAGRVIETASRPARLMTPTVAPTANTLRALRERRCATSGAAVAASPSAVASSATGSDGTDAVGTGPVARNAREARSKASASAASSDAFALGPAGISKASGASTGSETSTGSDTSTSSSTLSVAAGASAVSGSTSSGCTGASSIRARGASSIGASAVTRWRAARRESGVTAAMARTASAAATDSVGPTAGASEASVRSRLDRRVGAEAAWGFSKGKSVNLSVVRQARGAQTQLSPSGGESNDRIKPYRYPPGNAMNSSVFLAEQREEARMHLGPSGDQHGPRRIEVVARDQTHAASSTRSAPAAKSHGLSPRSK